MEKRNFSKLVSLILAFALIFTSAFSNIAFGAPGDVLSIITPNNDIASFMVIDRTQVEFTGIPGTQVRAYTTATITTIGSQGVLVDDGNGVGKLTLQTSFANGKNFYISTLSTVTNKWSSRVLIPFAENLASIPLPEDAVVVQQVQSTSTVKFLLTATNGFAAGDIVKVYALASSGTPVLTYTITPVDVSNGFTDDLKASLTRVTGSQVGTAYITIIRAGLNESARTAISYTGTLTTAAPDPSTIKVLYENVNDTPAVEVTAAAGAKVTLFVSATGNQFSTGTVATGKDKIIFGGSSTGNSYNDYIGINLAPYEEKGFYVAVQNPNENQSPRTYVPLGTRGSSDSNKLLNAEVKNNSGTEDTITITKLDEKATVKLFAASNGVVIKTATTASGISSGNGEVEFKLDLRPYEAAGKMYLSLIEYKTTDNGVDYFYKESSKVEIIIPKENAANLKDKIIVDFDVINRAYAEDAVVVSATPVSGTDAFKVGDTIKFFLGNSATPLVQKTVTVAGTQEIIAIPMGKLPNSSSQDVYVTVSRTGDFPLTIGNKTYALEPIRDVLGVNASINSATNVATVSGNLNPGEIVKIYNRPTDTIPAKSMTVPATGYIPTTGLRFTNLDANAVTAATICFTVTNPIVSTTLTDIAPYYGAGANESAKTMAGTTSGTGAQTDITGVTFSIVAKNNAFAKDFVEVSATITSDKFDEGYKVEAFRSSNDESLGIGFVVKDGANGKATIDLGTTKLKTTEGTDTVYIKVTKPGDTASVASNPSAAIPNEPKHATPTLGQVVVIKSTTPGKDVIEVSACPDPSHHASDATFVVGEKIRIYDDLGTLITTYIVTQADVSNKKAAIPNLSLPAQGTSIGVSIENPKTDGTGSHESAQSAVIVASPKQRIVTANLVENPIPNRSDKTVISLQTDPGAGVIDVGDRIKVWVTDQSAVAPAAGDAGAEYQVSAVNINTIAVTAVTSGALVIGGEIGVNLSTKLDGAKVFLALKRGSDVYGEPASFIIERQGRATQVAIADITIDNKKTGNDTVTIKNVTASDEIYIYTKPEDASANSKALAINASNAGTFNNGTLTITMTADKIPNFSAYTSLNTKYNNGGRLYIVKASTGLQFSVATIVEHEPAFDQRTALSSGVTLKRSGNGTDKIEIARAAENNAAGVAATEKVYIYNANDVDASGIPNSSAYLFNSANGLTVPASGVIEYTGSISNDLISSGTIKIAVAVEKPTSDANKLSKSQPYIITTTLALRNANATVTNNGDATSVVKITTSPSGAILENGDVITLYKADGTTTIGSPLTIASGTITASNIDLGAPANAESVIYATLTRGAVTSEKIAIKCPAQVQSASFTDGYDIHAVNRLTGSSESTLNDTAGDTIYGGRFPALASGTKINIYDSNAGANWETTPIMILTAGTEIAVDATELPVIKLTKSGATPTTANVLDDAKSGSLYFAIQESGRREGVRKEAVYNAVAKTDKTQINATNVKIVNNAFNYKNLEKDITATPASDIYGDTIQILAGLENKAVVRIYDSSASTTPKVTHTAAGSSLSTRRLSKDVLSGAPTGVPTDIDISDSASTDTTVYVTYQFAGKLESDKVAYAVKPLEMTPALNAGSPGITFMNLNNDADAATIKDKIILSSIFQEGDIITVQGVSGTSNTTPFAGGAKIKVPAANGNEPHVLDMYDYIAHPSSAPTQVANFIHLWGKGGSVKVSWQKLNHRPNTALVDITYGNYAASGAIDKLNGTLSNIAAFKNFAVPNTKNGSLIAAPANACQDYIDIAGFESFKGSTSSKDPIAAGDIVNFYLDAASTATPVITRTITGTGAAGALVADDLKLKLYQGTTKLLNDDIPTTVYVTITKKGYSESAKLAVSVPAVAKTDSIDNDGRLDDSKVANPVGTADTIDLSGINLNGVAIAAGDLVRIYTNSADVVKTDKTGLASTNYVEVVYNSGGNAATTTAVPITGLLKDRPNGDAIYVTVQKLGVQAVEIGGKTDAYVGLESAPYTIIYNSAPKTAALEAGDITIVNKFKPFDKANTDDATNDFIEYTGSDLTPATSKFYIYTVNPATITGTPTAAQKITISGATDIGKLTASTATPTTAANIKLDMLSDTDNTNLWFSHEAVNELESDPILITVAPPAKTASAGITAAIVNTLGTTDDTIQFTGLTTATGDRVNVYKSVNGAKSDLVAISEATGANTPDLATAATKFIVATPNFKKVTYASGKPSALGGAIDADDVKALVSDSPASGNAKIFVTIQKVGERESDPITVTYTQVAQTLRPTVEKAQPGTPTYTQQMVIERLWDTNTYKYAVHIPAAFNISDNATPAAATDEYILRAYTSATTDTANLIAIGSDLSPDSTKAGLKLTLGVGGIIAAANAEDIAEVVDKFVAGKEVYFTLQRINNGGERESLPSARFVLPLAISKEVIAANVKYIDDAEDALIVRAKPATANTATADENKVRFVYIPTGTTLTPAIEAAVIAKVNELDAEALNAGVTKTAVVSGATISAQTGAKGYAMLTGLTVANGDKIYVLEKGCALSDAYAIDGTEAEDLQ